MEMWRREPLTPCVWIEISVEIFPWEQSFVSRESVLGDDENETHSNAGVDADDGMPGDGDSVMKVGPRSSSSLWNNLRR